MARVILFHPCWDRLVSHATQLHVLATLFYLSSVIYSTNPMIMAQFTTFGVHNINPPFKNTL